LQNETAELKRSFVYSIIRFRDLDGFFTGARPVAEFQADRVLLPHSSDPGHQRFFHIY
jgi:hypothetical protein